MYMTPKMKEINDRLFKDLEDAAMTFIPEHSQTCKSRGGGDCDCHVEMTLIDIPDIIRNQEVLAEERASEPSQNEPDLTSPPCLECGAMTAKEAETMCICGGDKDSCHGCDLWPD